MIGLFARASVLSRNQLTSLAVAVQQQPVARHNGVNVVDLDVRPDKKVKKGKSRLKRKYLQKFPPVRKDKEGRVVVDGVSNKAFPCPIPWTQPEVILRDARHEDGSGDLG